MPNCYHCGQTIHFSSDVKSKNDKYIPLQGKTGTTKHNCAQNPFNRKRRKYSSSNRQQWWNQQQQWQQRHNRRTTVSEKLNSYLAILGLPPFCRSINEIKQAYRKLALLYHPDRSNNAATAGKFMEIHEAYEKCLQELENER